MRDRFKAFTGALFIVLGAIIIYRVAGIAGFRFEVVPGLVLGAAMMALGIYRIAFMIRALR